MSAYVVCPMKRPNKENSWTWLTPLSPPLSSMRVLPKSNSNRSLSPLTQRKKSWKKTSRSRRSLKRLRRNWTRFSILLYALIGLNLDKLAGTIPIWSEIHLLWWRIHGVMLQSLTSWRRVHQSIKKKSEKFIRCLGLCIKHSKIYQYHQQIQPNPLLPPPNSPLTISTPYNLKPLQKYTKSSPSTSTGSNNPPPTPSISGRKRSPPTKPNSPNSSNKKRTSSWPTKNTSRKSMNLWPWLIKRQWYWNLKNKNSRALKTSLRSLRKLTSKKRLHFSLSVITLLISSIMSWIFSLKTVWACRLTVEKISTRTASWWSTFRVSRNCLDKILSHASSSSSAWKKP